VTLLGSSEKLKLSQTAETLTIKVPGGKIPNGIAIVSKIK
jgi:hypothetical protein